MEKRRGMFKNGHQSWNKGMEWEEKQGEKHHNWKGDNAGTSPIHIWVKRYKGNVKNYKCKFCDKQAKHWANKKHDYQRNLDDYMALCVSCHRKYDIKYNGYKIKGKVVKLKDYLFDIK